MVDKIKLSVPLPPFKVKKLIKLTPRIVPDFAPLISQILSLRPTNVLFKLLPSSVSMETSRISKVSSWLVLVTPSISVPFPPIIKLDTLLAE